MGGDHVDWRTSSAILDIQGLKEEETVRSGRSLRGPVSTALGVRGAGRPECLGALLGSWTLTAGREGWLDGAPSAPTQTWRKLEGLTVSERKDAHGWTRIPLRRRRG